MNKQLILNSVEVKVKSKLLNYDWNHNYSSDVGLIIREVNTISMNELRVEIFNAYLHVEAFYYSWEKIINHVLENQQKHKVLFTYINKTLEYFSIAELIRLERKN